MTRFLLRQGEPGTSQYILINFTVILLIPYNFNSLHPFIAHVPDNDFSIIYPWQIRVVARDGGTPPQSAVTLVYVNVNRNLNAPRFNQGNYQQTVLETQPLGVPFVRVQAQDSDQRVSIHLSLCLQFLYFGIIL